MNVCYLGPLKDYSGMGEANRHAVAALHAAGVTVLPQVVNYSLESSDFGSIGRLVDSMLDNKGEYKIKILHTTPNQFKKLSEPGKYHIGHFFWETDRVPDQFAEGLELMDEIWTGSEASVQAIKAAGVTKRVIVFPQAIETHREWPKPYKLHDFDGYLFYSIFEWTDRKNPADLLKAYYGEFTADDKVGLLIKTYFSNFTLPNKRMIRHMAQQFKIQSGNANPPPVFLYLDIMDRTQIMRLHKSGDCYVSAHRGEGWGVPQAEALLAGRPLISTAYGGIHEYLTHGVDALLLPYKLVQLRGMRHAPDWYDGRQKWAQPDVAALRGAMRYAYSHQDLMVKKGERGRDFVLKNLDLKTVGAAMADRLEAIEAGL